MADYISIDAKGFGKVYKRIMRDRTLPLLAKSLYSYLCSYAGRDDKAFPKRDKIVRDLAINKDTFSKHMHILVSAGFLSIQRTATGNIYHIEQNVPRYETPEVLQEEESHTDLLVMDNIRAQGFGTIAKLVMLDSRLSAQAKGIYAYFASFAGAGTTAFPRRSTILRDLSITLVTYYKHFNQLKELGYISVEPQKNGGRFDVSVYRLADQVAMSEKIVHGGKPRIAMSEKLYPEKLYPEKLIYEKPGHASIKNSSKINSSHKEQNQNQQGAGDLQLVKKLIGFDNLVKEAMAWGELKETLGHFTHAEEKELYRKQALALLTELVVVFQMHLSTDIDPDRLQEITGSDAFTDFVEDLIARIGEIRATRAYLAAAVRNLLANEL